MPDRDALAPLPRRQELEKARNKGQVIGFLQGAGTMFALGLVLKLVGWIPVVLLGAGAAYVGYRVLFPRRK